MLSENINEMEQAISWREDVRDLREFLRFTGYVIAGSRKFLWLFMNAYVSVFAAVIIAFSFAAMIVFSRMYGYRLYVDSVRVFGTYYTQLLIGIIVITTGLLAHRFKQWNQIWYGAVEVIFGCVSSIAIASSLSPSNRILGPLSSLIGCAYVIARGMNNVRWED